ncbi:MAG TPA: THxN family PEP-CTERM protein, partial [Gammaproteobacteria bacterium]|nr:THxN family PEP-CTERM protein [Gammaproteobacteria bacterium]
MASRERVEGRTRRAQSAPRMLLAFARRAPRAALIFGLAALAPAGIASAAEITYVSISGTWHDAMDNMPGVQPGDPVITNGTPTSSISWGTTAGSQSGYDFTAVLPAPITFPGPGPGFSLGSFTHRNFEVADPSLTSVQLDVTLVLDVDGVQTPPLVFTFTFNHEETPNNASPCPYPTPPMEGCTDRVTIVASPQPTTFSVGGVDYTLAMSFNVNGSPTSEYITREGGTLNTSGLTGSFILPPIPPGAPALTMDKTGPATMNPAEPRDFTLDVRNAGTVDAFNVTLLDRLPDGPTGGMCDTTPQITSARVFAADGVTPVPGKGPLVQGSDYSFAYDGAACELTLTTLTAASVIGVNERLIVVYRTQLDAGSQYTNMLTNVAGATQWFNAAASNPVRSVYTRMLTDGTVGIVDHEDAHTVTVVP